MTQKTPTFTRRTFLKTTGALVLAAALKPGSPVLAAPLRPVTLGVLTAPNVFYPDAAAKFLAALQGATRQGLTWRIAQALPGLEAMQGYTQAWLKDVDGIVALLSPSAAQALRPLFVAAHKPLFVSTPGVNAARAEEKHPLLLENSLAWWRGTARLGQWAAAHTGHSAFGVCAFYDSGFDTAYAFQAGFEAAGGQWAGTVVSHRPTDKDGFAVALAAIRAANPAVVFASYSGVLAAKFMQAYTAAGLTAPVFGTPWMAEAARAAGAASAGLKTSATGPAFAHPYALLGGQAGRQVAHHFGLAEAGAQPEFNLCEVRATRRGWQSVAVAPLPDQLGAGPELATPRTGWLHDYGVLANGVLTNSGL